jgi:hypothetical protein
MVYPVFDIAGFEIGMPWRKGIMQGREEFCDLKSFWAESI